MKCERIWSLAGLEKWNVSKSIDFKEMFNGCSALTDIESLKYWDVPSGCSFSSMFSKCISLSNLNPILEWDIPNDQLSSVFYGCFSLVGLPQLRNLKK